MFCHLGQLGWLEITDIDIIKVLQQIWTILELCMINLQLKDLILE